MAGTCKARFDVCFGFSVTDTHKRVQWLQCCESPFCEKNSLAPYGSSDAKQDKVSFAISSLSFCSFNTVTDTKDVGMKILDPMGDPHGPIAASLSCHLEGILSLKGKIGSEQALISTMY